MNKQISVLGNMRLVGSVVLDQDNVDFPLNPRLGTLLMKGGSLYAYTTINGVSTWFPLFQNLSNAYLHTQVNPTTTWTVNHQLGSTFCWYQIKDTDGNILFESSSENTDANTTVLTFNEPVSGTAIFIGPNSVMLNNINASLLTVGGVEITTTGITIGGVSVATTANAGQSAPEVIEVRDYAQLPTTGEAGKIYVNLDATNLVGNPNFYMPFLVDFNNNVYQTPTSDNIGDTYITMDYEDGSINVINLTMSAGDIGTAAFRFNFQEDTVLDFTLYSASGMSNTPVYYGVCPVSEITTFNPTTLVVDQTNTVISATVNAVNNCVVFKVGTPNVGFYSLIGIFTANNVKLNTGVIGNASIVPYNKKDAFPFATSIKYVDPLLGNKLYYWSGDRYIEVSPLAVSSVAGRTGDVLLTIDDIPNALSGALIGVPDGIAPLDANGLIAAAYLPSYVDAVEEYNGVANFPATGVTSRIYLDISTNGGGKIYRWSGSTYVEISPSPGSTDSVVEGSVNLYHTTARVNALISTFAAGGTVYKADRLSTPRTINITGAVVGSATFDGSSDITIMTAGGTLTGGGGGALSSLYANFSGPVTPMVGDSPWYPRSAVTFTNVFAYLSANASSTVTATIRKNGTVVQTITIPAGQKTSTTAVNLGFTASDYMTIDIVGGSGNNLSLRLDY